MDYQNNTSPLLCGNCNAALESTARFCTNCGNPVVKTAPAQEAEQQSYQQATAQEYRQPVQGYQQSTQGYQQPVQGYQQPAQGYQQPSPQNAAYGTGMNGGENMYQGQQNNTFYGGAPQPQTQNAAFAYDPIWQNPEAVDGTKFYDKIASKKTKGWVIALGVMSIFSGLIAISNIIYGDYFAIIDIVLYIALGIVTLTKKNWVAALVITCDAALGLILLVISSGFPMGFLVVIAGVIATIKLRKIDGAYKAYKQSGQLPREQI